MALINRATSPVKVLCCKVCSLHHIQGINHHGKIKPTNTSISLSTVSLSYFREPRPIFMVHLPSIRMSWISWDAVETNWCPCLHLYLIWIVIMHATVSVQLAYYFLPLFNKYMLKIAQRAQLILNNTALSQKLNGPTGFPEVMEPMGLLWWVQRDQMCWLESRLRLRLMASVAQTQIRTLLITLMDQFKT